ncbi:MAG: dTMP kinase [Porcipelethomonas sp.]
MNKGKLIVIDGLDGSGKSTQLEITGKKLENMGYNVKTISFPDYSSPSSALVKMYLSGEFSSDPDDINAYAASSFYAVDRYASYMKYWKGDYENGAVILAARYVSSNALHQMSKLESSKWDDYLHWLYDYEYTKLGLPEADEVIFLDMPVEVSQRLLTGRYDGNEEKKDIHEADVDYLKKCRKAAIYASEKLSWRVIECSSGGEPLSVEEVSGRIMETLEKDIF